MGRFDGILILSDWDGTLCYQRQVHPRAIKAIEYFRENGGYFTVASGRGSEYIKSCEHIFKPDDIVISNNGSVIRSIKTGEAIRALKICKESIELVDRLMDSGLFSEVTFKSEGKTTQVFREQYNDYRAESKEPADYGYMLTANTEDDLSRALELLDEIPHSEMKIMKSWSRGIEIVHKSSGKGEAALALKKHLNARRLITVGDYDNDVDMLRVADISFAMGNGTDTAKECATHVIGCVTEGGVADIIEYLENEAE